MNVIFFGINADFSEDIHVPYTTVTGLYQGFFGGGEILLGFISIVKS